MSSQQRAPGSQWEPLEPLPLVADRLLAQARRVSEEAEVHIHAEKGLSVEVRMQAVESLQFHQSRRLSLTVYRQGRKGIARTNDFSEQGLQQLVKAASDIAQYTTSDPCNGLADPAELAFEAPAIESYYPSSLTPEAAIRQAQSLEATALALDPRITNSEGSSVGGGESWVCYGNSLGMLQQYGVSAYRQSCSLIASADGAMERDSAYSMVCDPRDFLATQALAETAVRKAVARLGSRPLKTQRSPVIFSHEVAPQIFEAFVQAIAGEAIYQNASFLCNQVGQVIFPQWFSIHEKPHLPKALAAQPFDSDGVRTRPSLLVERGVLQHYLLDKYSAKKLQLPLTGHASGVGPCLLEGPVLSLEALLKAMGTGFFVTELLGHGTNLLTGDYSQGAAGFWVEAGEIAYPVSGVTIAGRLQDIFQNIVGIGDDADPQYTIRSGALWVSDLQIAGSGA